MKNTFTFKELFSEFDDDIISVPEDTVFGDTDISTDAIKNAVLLRSGCRKKRHKGIRMILIAAAIIVISGVCSTMILADTDIRIAFEEFFGGNMNSAGLYDGGNVTVRTDDPNLDISFLGLTGDEHEMYAVIRASKKDGGTFTDEGYLYPYMTSDWKAMREYMLSLNGKTDTTPDELQSAMASFCGIEAVCTDRYGSNFGYENEGDAMIDAKYYLSDDRKQIKILIHLDIDNASGTKHLDARDGTLTVKSACFTAQKIVNTFFTDELSDEVSTGTAWNRFEKLFKGSQESVENMSVIYTPQRAIFCQTDKKEYALPFELTFTMNYRYNACIRRTLKQIDSPHYINENVPDAQMTVSPFSIRFDGETDHTDISQCFEDVDIDNSYVLMKDGTKYCFRDWGCSGGGGPASGKIESHSRLTYTLKPHSGLEEETILIDTREIAQITINGDIVYKA